MTYATYVMYKQDIEFFTKEVILKLWYQTLTKLNKTSTFIEFAECHDRTVFGVRGSE